MKLSSKDIAELEAWWAGELPQPQVEALQKRMAEDPDFRSAAEEWKKIVGEGFAPTKEELAERVKLGRQLSTIESGLPPVKTPSQSWINWLYIGAAAVVILLLIYLFIRRPFSPYDSQVASFITHLPRDNANLSDLATPGERAYDQKKYRQAWPLLVAEIQAPEDSLNLLFAGVAALHAGQPEIAVSFLETLLVSNQWKDYSGPVKWYLALSYVETDRTEEAIEQLKDLTASGSRFRDNASELLMLLQE